MKRTKIKPKWGKHPHIVKNQKLMMYLETMPRNFDYKARIIPKTHTAGNFSHRKNLASISSQNTRKINIRVFGK